MLFSKIKVLRDHRYQSIGKLGSVELKAPYRGRPEILHDPDPGTAQYLASLCPTGAIAGAPFSIDLGKCCFCGECTFASRGAVAFTQDYRMASNIRNNLVVTSRSAGVIFDPDAVRREIYSYFGNALKLRQVSAGGDNSTEMELNAAMNVNFDFGRYGVEFVASPRHADGVVVTGPITSNMAAALDICYCSVAEPKLVILAGCDAISGGVFARSPALDRSFEQRYAADLYLPGNPVHPLTFIDGILKLLRR